jgi:hypothetical protein
MYVSTRALPAGLILLACLTAARADEAAEKLEALKKNVQASWALLDAGEPVLHETAHFLIVADKGLEKRLKDVGALLEKSEAKAAEALKLDPKEPLWPTKLTV